MNRKTISNTLLAASASTALLFLFGCTGGSGPIGFGLAYQGGGAFNSPTSISLLVARPTGYSWRKMDAPYDAASSEVFKVQTPPIGMRQPSFQISQSPSMPARWSG